MARNNSAARRWLVGIFAILIGFVIAALAAEALARVFFDEPVQPRFVVDSGYGVRWNQANVDTRHYSPGEYDVRVTTNSVGHARAARVQPRAHAGHAPHRAPGRLVHLRLRRRGRRGHQRGARGPSQYPGV